MLSDRRSWRVRRVRIQSIFQAKESPFAPGINKIYVGVDKSMFDLRLQVVIYPEREWSDWESRPQQRWLLFCGLNTYRLQIALLGTILCANRHDTSTKTWTQNSAIDSHLFGRVNCQECRPPSKHKVASWNLLCSVALDASFSCNSTQTILGRCHFGIRCMGYHFFINHGA